MSNSSNIIKRYDLNGITVVYLKNEQGITGFLFVPTELADDAEYDVTKMGSLVQLHFRGDTMPAGFINGYTLTNTSSTFSFVYDSQNIEKNNGETVITTRLTNNNGLIILHKLTHRDTDRSFTVRSVLENRSGKAIVLESISSFSVGNLTPFGGKRDTDKMVVHRARSWWSAEGRIVSETLENMHMEPSWSFCGVRNERFGTVGSMPVRQFFPYVAVEDKAANVTWAVQLANPSSWQIEMLRQGDSLVLVGGLADYDFGHWSKTINDGESFETPAALMTVGVGGCDQISQQLLDLHPKAPNLEGLPVIFNEFCTTWGNPCEENIKKIVNTIKNRGVDYFVIDAGWYGTGNWNILGDWSLNEKMFPNGLGAAVNAIREAGMKPGIWFEPENCTAASDIPTKHPDWVLRRHGTHINTGTRMFLNLTNSEVREYLKEVVIDFLNKWDFDYIKIDYNESIGIGCDHPDGLGEGLRQSVLASQDFFRQLRREVPGIIIENCSSGGHRLEPSMMALCDVASFSDAHECVQIPIIAANMHRLIRPDKSEIWAVIRGEDSARRINYSLVNTLLGVMCLSGNIYDIAPDMWKIIDDAIAFYKKYSHIIADGTSYFYGSGTSSYGSPEGWQAVLRRSNTTGETMAVIHTFGGEIPERISLPVQVSEICDVLCSECNEITLKEGVLEVELKTNFEAVAVALK